MTYEKFLNICRRYGLESQEAIKAGRELEKLQGVGQK